MRVNVENVSESFDVPPPPEGEPSVPENAASKLRALMERAGHKFNTLAIAAGYKGASGIQRYLNPHDYKQKYLKRELVERLEPALVGRGTPPITKEDVWSLAGMPPPPPSDEVQSRVELPAFLRAHPVEFGKPDLPVLGRAQGGRGVLMIPVEQPAVDWVQRPPQLMNVVEAFSVLVYDDSMAPRYTHGQVLYIHPFKPIAPGNGILIVKHNDEALVKELVRRTGRAWILREYRPKERDFEIPTSEVRWAYRIIGAIDP